MKRRVLHLAAALLIFQVYGIRVGAPRDDAAYNSGALPGIGNRTISLPCVRLEVVDTTGPLWCTSVVAKQVSSERLACNKTSMSSKCDIAMSVCYNQPDIVFEGGIMRSSSGRESIVVAGCTKDAIKTAVCGSHILTALREVIVSHCLTDDDRPRLPRRNYGRRLHVAQGPTNLRNISIEPTQAELVTRVPTEEPTFLGTAGVTEVSTREPTILSDPKPQSIPSCKGIPTARPSNLALYLPTIKPSKSQQRDEGAYAPQIGHDEDDQGTDVSIPISRKSIPPFIIAIAVVLSTTFCLVVVVAWTCWRQRRAISLNYSNLDCPWSDWSVSSSPAGHFSVSTVIHRETPGCISGTVDSARFGFTGDDMEQPTSWTIRSMYDTDACWNVDDSSINTADRAEDCFTPSKEKRGLRLGDFLNQLD